MESDSLLCEGTVPLEASSSPDQRTAQTEADVRQETVSDHRLDGEGAREQAAVHGPDNKTECQ